MWAALVLAHAVEPCEGAVSSLPSTPRSTPRAGEAGAAGAEAGDGEEEGGDNGAAEAGGGTKPEEDWEDTVERLLLTSEWTAPDAKFDDGCLPGPAPRFAFFLALRAGPGGQGQRRTREIRACMTRGARAHPRTHAPTRAHECSPNARTQCTRANTWLHRLSRVLLWWRRPTLVGHRIYARALGEGTVQGFEAALVGASTHVVRSNRI